MKDWATDHPKAKLMARKREAILAAAHDVFLRDGYGGASMEAIAAAAKVSIMTLYRHAESKDDLFAAVIESACHPADRAEQAQLDEALRKPLTDILIFVAVMFQDRLASPATTTLLRAVMVETKRFPHLADMAFRGLIGSHVEALDHFLSQRAEAASLAPDERRKLGSQFLNHLVGIDSFSILLGLGGVSKAEKRERAISATHQLVASLPSH